MATLVEKLELTAAALERDDAAAALAHVIDAWRGQRHPRIGALAARISTLASARRPPIAGKTVKARLAAWLEAEPEHDLVDVERLLADPWPTQWRDGDVRFERIVKWAPDPRVAAHLINAFVDPPYQSQASWSLRIRFAAHLVALADPRLLGVLEVVKKNVGSHMPAVDAAKLAEILDPAAEPLIVQLEARFAGAVRNEASTKKTAAEFLEAIYAEPDDTTHKVVFADWLTENGDPRGELISLQLAGVGSSRERALIAKIGDDHATWDWPLAEKFKRGTRRYEEGFFAGGHLDQRRTEFFEHAAWSHVRAIELDYPEPYGAEIAFLAKLPRLRELTNIGAQFVLPALEATPIEVLEIVEATRHDAPALDANHPIATTKKLAHLKTLGVACTRYGRSDVASLPDWPILRRLERLMLRNTSGHFEIQELLAKLVGPKVVEVRPDRWIHTMDDAKMIYRLERSESTGPFRRIALRSGDYSDVVAVLDTFPEKSFDFIALDLKRAQLSDGQRARIVDALTRFPGAKVEPAFEAPKTAPAPKKEVVAVMTFRLDGPPLNEPESVGRAMRLAGELGVTFDTYRIGWGGKDRALKPDPIKKAEAMAKPGKDMTITQSDSESRLWLRGKRDQSQFDLALGREEVARALDWALALAADPLNQVTRFSLALSPRPYVRPDSALDDARNTINPFNLWPDWRSYAVLLDEKWSARLLPRYWAKHLPSEPALAGVFFREVGNRRLIGLHADPLAMPTLEEHQALARLVHRIVADAWEDTYGYRWRELADEILAPALRELGLDKTTTFDMRWLAVKYGDETNRRRFEVMLRDPFESTMELITDFECSSENGGWHNHSLTRGPAPTRAATVALLEKAAATALADRAWFDDPVLVKKWRS